MISLRQSFAATISALSSLTLLTIFIGLWWILSASGWINRAFLPTPMSTATCLVNGLLSGELLVFTFATLQRMLIGWMLASVLGIVLGASIGSSLQVRTWILPTLEFIRPLPASAVIPLAIALLGLSSEMVLAVVAFGSMWPVLLATMHGLNSVHPRLREVSQALQLGHLSYILKIALPNALPDIFAGIRLSMTVSLIVSVVGEMIASQSGLGQSILLAARSFQASELYAGIVMLSAIGFATNALVSTAEHHLLRWQHS